MRRAAWIIAAAGLSLAGCGQKGPLYLPDKNAQVVTTSVATPAPEPAPAAATPATPVETVPEPEDQNDGTQTPK